MGGPNDHHLLPDIATKYGCGLCDIHTDWLAYLKDNHLQPDALLLPDHTHLNGYGNWLMARLTSRYLVYRPELSDSGWNSLTRTWTVGKDVNWAEGKLKIDFEGNRVDLLPSADAPAGRKVSVTIDGKKPSEFPGAYRITRPAPGPWSPLFLSRVDHDSPLTIEDWTLKLTSVSADGKQWTYDVSGSVTGADGSGKSDEVFTSKSGRVKIEPAAWFRGFNPPLPNGYEVKWQVLPMFSDTFESTAVSDASKENATTLAQGIPSGKHTLELTCEKPSEPPMIAAVRTYDPPVKMD